MGTYTKLGYTFRTCIFGCVATQLAILMYFAYTPIARFRAALPKIQLL
jgi:hypothetical protein